MSTAISARPTSRANDQRPLHADDQEIQGDVDVEENQDAIKINSRQMPKIEINDTVNPSDQIDLDNGYVDNSIIGNSSVDFGSSYSTANILGSISNSVIYNSQLVDSDASGSDITGSSVSNSDITDSYIKDSSVKESILIENKVMDSQLNNVAAQGSLFFHTNIDGSEAKSIDNMAVIDGKQYPLESLSPGYDNLEAESRKTATDVVVDKLNSYKDKHPNESWSSVVGNVFPPSSEVNQSSPPSDGATPTQETYSGIAAKANVPALVSGLINKNVAKEFDGDASSHRSGATLARKVEIGRLSGSLLGNLTSGGDSANAVQAAADIVQNVAAIHRGSATSQKIAGVVANSSNATAGAAKITSAFTASTGLTDPNATPEQKAAASLRLLDGVNSVLGGTNGTIKTLVGAPPPTGSQNNEVPQNSTTIITAQPRTTPQATPPSSPTLSRTGSQESLNAITQAPDNVPQVPRKVPVADTSRPSPTLARETHATHTNHLVTADVHVDASPPSSPTLSRTRSQESLYFTPPSSPTLSRTGSQESLYFSTQGTPPSSPTLSRTGSQESLYFSTQGTPPSSPTLSRTGSQGNAIQNIPVTQQSNAPDSGLRSTLQKATPKIGYGLLAAGGLIHTANAGLAIHTGIQKLQDNNPKNDVAGGFEVANGSAGLLALAGTAARPAAAATNLALSTAVQVAPRVASLANPALAQSASTLARIAAPAVARLAPAIVGTAAGAATVASGVASVAGVVTTLGLYIDALVNHPEDLPRPPGLKREGGSQRHDDTHRAVWWGTGKFF